MKIKKILSLILAVFILLGAVIPTTNAAKWHVSSIDKTYFEIPPDDRNLRDFVFGNQVINYKKWSDDSDSWSSMEATITANMMWYKTTFNPSPTQGLKVITNEDISTFFVVVDNSFYKPEGTFAFPIYKTHKIEYMYMYWKSDEDQNYCLYLDLENKGTEVYKIKHTCHMQLYDRDPFLLFFQVGRTGYDLPRYGGNVNTIWYIKNEDSMPTYKISVTTTHKAKYKEKDYITFNVPEVFHLEVPKFNNAYGGAYNSNSFMNNSSFSLTDQKKTKNTLKSEQFLRQGNQRAFRPYSFYFEKDLLKRFDEINADETLKAKHCHEGHCQITSPFDYTSFFESFVLSVSAQYYNSPAVVNDNTYIEAPDSIEGEGFDGCKNNVLCYVGEGFGLFKDTVGCGWFGVGCANENGENSNQNNPYGYGSFRECGITEIGCHIANVFTFLGNIFKFLVNGLIDGLKGIILWIFEGIKSFIWPIFEPIFNFFKPVWTDILEPVYNFFFGFFKPIWQLATREIQFNDLVWGNQQYICSKNRGFYIDTETPASLRPSELLGFFLLFVSPFPPQDGSLMCTSIGMKQIEYGRSTIVDTTIFLFFIFAGFWFLLFIVRR